MFYDNLKQACDINNVKITPIVAECGGAKGSISNWKKGAYPNSDIVAKLAVRLNVSTDFLIFGKDHSPTERLTTDEQELITYYKELDMMRKGQVLERAKVLSEQVKTIPKVPKNTILIDFYDLPASAGTGVYLDDCDEFKIEVERSALTEQTDFALRISGDSMEPEFHSGDIVLVKAQPEVEIGEIGIFIVNGKGFIKKYDGDYLLSINPEYSDIPLHEYDEIYCRGKVIGIV